MVKLTPAQSDVLEVEGHQLIVGGPGSGKTTVSILKAAKIAREKLKPGQRILFLSFARATVSRVFEAISEEVSVTYSEKNLIEVDTYHSFFWKILKTHGYLVGFPRRMNILVPPNEAIALSGIRSSFKAPSQLSSEEKIQKAALEDAELMRLATEEGKICFGMFAERVAILLHGSTKVRELVSTRYPFIILDEFQDTTAQQWRAVEAIGKSSKLIALADPEQRIFDFIGADPERLNHFKEAFAPCLHDFAGENHRSKGTDITEFGNHVLTGKFRDGMYRGISCILFDSNQNQAFSALVSEVLKARKRLCNLGKPDWSLAILVPTKRMTRLVSESLRAPFGRVPPIAHAAAVDMEGPILAAEVIAFLLQQRNRKSRFDEFIGVLCDFFEGRGGAKPANTHINESTNLKAALVKWNACVANGRDPPRNSMLRATYAIYQDVIDLVLSGQPDSDWSRVRNVLESGNCKRLAEVGQEARNVRLLERGTQLRQSLSKDWRDTGSYRNALAITRQAFVQEHFATAHKPESGIVVMNMHKAKGKQFDEVIIFEGWPIWRRREIVSNPDRIVARNLKSEIPMQARQNFRVSLTRAKMRTTIMTPREDICVLILRNI